MDKNIFEKCNILYFKTKNNFDNIVKLLKGKIVISDYKDLNDICSLNGIIHVYNSEGKIPEEKIDCIICNKKDIDLETKIIKLDYDIPILYIGENEIKKWCSFCHSIKNLDNKPIYKHCTDECLQKNNKFMQNFKIDKDLSYNEVKSKQYQKNILIEFDKKDTTLSSSSKKNDIDKLQTSIVKDAVRLDYAIKREIYKKEIRQPSLRKTSISSSKKKEDINEEQFSKICKGKTKKGEKCTNKTIKGSNYCGILSHSIT